MENLVPGNAAPEQAAPQGNVVSPSQALKDSVSDKLAGSGPKVRETLVQVRVDDEVKRRVEIGKQGVQLLERLEGELKGVKPDVQNFDGDGQALPVAYSKGQLEKRKKTTEKVEAISKAVREAFENDKFDDLQKAIQKFGQQQGGEQGNKSPEAKGPDGD